MGSESEYLYEHGFTSEHGGLLNSTEYKEIESDFNSLENLAKLQRLKSVSNLIQELELWFSLSRLLDERYYKRSFAILTAWNPNNKPTTDIENISANDLLKKDLSIYEVKHSIGKYKEHEEVSFLVYNIELDEAITLGRKYNQYSIFYNDTNRLSYIECSSRKVLVEKKL